MKVTINGKIEEVRENLTVRELLESYKLKPEITIVEKNQVIIGHGQYNTEPICSGDQIELIRYMGGG